MAKKYPKTKGFEKVKKVMTEFYAGKLKTSAETKVTKKAQPEPLYKAGEFVKFTSLDESIYVGRIVYDATISNSIVYFVSTGDTHEYVDESDIIGRSLSLSELNSQMIKASYESREKEQSLYSEYFNEALLNEGFNKETAALISYKAYEDGHSSGYCEVVGCALDLSDFVKNILRANKNN